MAFKLVDVEDLVAQAKASGVSRISVDVPLLASYGQEACVSQTQWMTGPHFTKTIRGCTWAQMECLSTLGTVEARLLDRRTVELPGNGSSENGWAASTAWLSWRSECAKRMLKASLSRC